jgi:DNA-binding GntR family transcriptional regulator
MTSKGLCKISQRLIRDSVLSSLRAAILDGAFQPGEHLVETELAERLGTSRGPVRDALKELAQEGLVVISPYKGAQVATFSAQDIKEICALRSLLEGYATRKAVERATPCDIEHLQKILDEMQDLADVDDRSALVEKDIEFHQEICRLAGNERLFKVWSLLASQVRLFLILTDQVFFDADFIVTAHASIMEGICNKDPEAAEKAITFHLCEAAKTIMYELQHSESAEEEQEAEVVR